MNKKIRNLSLGGGGFYGYGAIGVLKELEKYPDIFDFENIIGASVGGLLAAVYSIGYTIDEITSIMFNIDFNKLIKDNNLSYLNLWNNFGLYNANGLEEYIEKVIRDKTNIKFCTFSQINKNLTIVITNLNYQKPVYLNKENSPDMPISKAVRISMGYPFMMTPILYEGDLCGDGGEFLNYPINYFDDLYDIDETIGIKFAANDENHDGTLKKRTEINTIHDYVKSMIMTMTRAAHIYQLSDKHLERSIVVEITLDIESMQFDLTLEQKQEIFNCGVISAQNQLYKFMHD